MKKLYWIKYIDYFNLNKHVINEYQTNNYNEMLLFYEAINKKSVYETGYKLYKISSSFIKKYNIIQNL